MLTKVPATMRSEMPGGGGGENIFKDLSAEVIYEDFISDMGHVTVIVKIIAIVKTVTFS